MFIISYIWMSPPGRQLTIFNTQATVAIGGSDRSRPFQGQLSGLYYNGLKVLNMAAEGNPNIKINGSVRLVGDVPSVAGSARSTAMPPDMSTTFTETTTMMSTTTTRKLRSSSTVQVWTDLHNHQRDDLLIIYIEGGKMHPYLLKSKQLIKTFIPNQILQTRECHKSSIDAFCNWSKMCIVTYVSCAVCCSCCTNMSLSCSVKVDRSIKLASTSYINWDYVYIYICFNSMSIGIVFIGILDLSWIFQPGMYYKVFFFIKNIHNDILVADTDGQYPVVSVQMMKWRFKQIEQSLDDLIFNFKNTYVGVRYSNHVVLLWNCKT